MVLQSYDAWVKCITVGCKIEITAPFARARLRALRDRSDAHTQRYVELYGESHLAQVIGWFERALEDEEARETP